MAEGNLGQPGTSITCETLHIGETYEEHQHNYHANIELHQTNVKLEPQINVEEHLHQTVMVHHHHYHPETTHQPTPPQPNVVTIFDQDAIRIDAIKKHQEMHLKNLPENVVLHGLSVEENQLPEVFPGMHEFKAYRGEDLSMKDQFVSSTLRKVASSPNQQPVSFDEITNLASQKKFVALIGPPGSGKTTISKRLAKLSQSNQSAKFLLRFMDLNYKEHLTFKQLFIDFLCPELNEEMKENAYQWMVENPDKCVFVFDGYDQSMWSLENMKPLNASYNTPLSIQQLVANLCCKKFFKESLLIFTSRHHSMLNIPSDLRPGVTVHVDDLSTEDMKKLFYAFAGEKADELWKMLTARAVQLLGLCHNPLLLQFVIFAVLHQDLNRVNTFSEVFQSVLEQLRYSEHAQGMDINKLWEPLGKMAYKGMQQKTVVFTNEHLKEEGLDATVVQDIIISFARYIGFSTQRLFDGDQLFYFTHQMLQEMLAAKYMCNFMSEEEFLRGIKQVAIGGHWSMVRRFLCGLLLGVKDEKESSFCQIDASLAATNINIEDQASSSSSNTTRTQSASVQRKRRTFSKVFQKKKASPPAQLSAPECTRKEKSSTFHHLLIKMLKDSYGIDLLELLIDLQECSDEVINSCAKHIPVGNFSFTPFSLSGAHALTQILPRLDRPVEQLDLRHCNLNSESLKWICEGISKMKYKIKELALDGNKIGEDGVQHLTSCLDKIERLVLWDCNITCKKVQIMVVGLQILETPIKALNLSCNKIGDEGVRQLTPGLDKIEKLVLRECNITAHGVQFMSGGLEKLRIPLKRLDLSGNRICDEGVGHLSSHLDKMEELVLVKCNITSTGVDTLSVRLKKLPLSMKGLDLSYNKIGDGGVRHLTSCLEKVEKLVLRDCKITPIGVKLIGEGIEMLVIPVLPNLRVFITDEGD